MCHAKTYHMMLPDQLSQVKEKAQHNKVSQERKKQKTKKACNKVMHPNQ